MIGKEISRLYTYIRLQHYTNLFGKVKEKAGSLSATEAFSAEVIYLLNNPTITEFADFIGISGPNATYKINSLIAKGYLLKVPSEADKREYRLSVTDKFREYYGSESPYIKKGLEGLRTVLTSDELDQLEKLLRKINDAILQKKARKISGPV